MSVALLSDDKKNLSVALFSQAPVMLMTMSCMSGTPKPLQTFPVTHKPTKPHMEAARCLKMIPWLCCTKIWSACCLHSDLKSDIFLVQKVTGSQK